MIDNSEQFRYLQSPVMKLQTEAGEGKPRKFAGYAAVFNSRSEPLDRGTIEIIKPGAFAETIKAGNIRALLNHNPQLPMGNQATGTLRLWEDEHGLRFELQPADTSYVRDLQELVSHGDVQGASFHIKGWTKREYLDGATPIREVSRFEIDEISILTVQPAYSATSVELRKGVSPTPLLNRNKRLLLLLDTPRRI